MFPSDTKILYCDDMGAIREMVGIELRRLGYSNLVAAHDGGQAWEMYLQCLRTTPVGLIISDWNMPNMTGFQFLERVRKHSERSDTPFVLLTAEGQKEQVLDAIAMGVTQYILKPFTAKNFEEKLKLAWQKVQSAKSA
jgi:two-component system chemotaxis response regulator CheY